MSNLNETFDSILTALSGHSKPIQRLYKLHNEIEAFELSVSNKRDLNTDEKVQVKFFKTEYSRVFKLLTDGEMNTYPETIIKMQNKLINLL